MSQSPRPLLIEELLGSQSSPIRIQVAHSGEWETARRYTPEGLAAADPSELCCWAGGAVDLAIEIFFGEGLEAPFIGVRPDGPARSVVDTACQLASQTPSLARPREVVTLVQDSIGQVLFTGDVEFIEVGIVNAWKSLGSVVVWSRITGFAPEADRLLCAQGLLEPRERPAAVELAMRAPISHWVGLPIADRVSEGYRLDPGRLRTAIRLLLGPESSR